MHVVMKSDKLKRCPFCGNEAMLVEQRSGGFYVRCEVCEARTMGGTIEQAIEFWNTRRDTPIKRRKK